MPPSTPYVLIAISNVTRAAAFRHVANESLRLETIVVRDGDDAVQEMTRRGWPALLIVDLSLPRVDGFTVVRRVRRGTPDPQTHIIVVSAHESLRVAARELSPSLGISGILPLDVDPATLRSMIFAGLDPSREERAVPAAPPDTREPKANPALDPEEVVERAAVEARRRYRMPISVGYLCFADQEGLTYHLAAREGEAPLTSTDLLDVEVLRQVAESTEPLVVPDLENHPLFTGRSGVVNGQVRGLAAVPIPSSRDYARAALCLLDTKPLALNATEIDALTGVANRRGGEKHIANEVSRAKREKRPLSCILIDIDRFKAVNDTFGHQAGDQLLRDISALLRRTVRAYDILVRWGGEEFLLVLPGVGLELARILADRLRAAVEALDTHGIGPVTISAGAAEFENDYEFASTLRTADRRLYQAKASGRNCVV